MLKIFTLLMLINTMMMYMTKTPFSLGLMLLIQTLLISISSGMLTLSFWYSYMLFLIILGSLLIIFIYVSSLISNVKFLFNKWMLLNMFIIAFTIMFIKFNTINFLFEDLMKFNDISTNKIFLMKMSMNKLFNKPIYIITFMMMNYLFITLIIVVKIANINMGSLRKTF
uniref:NADH dehydrogenase subunit 6 n=1 Tax=Neodiprion huizeensis TaxID=2980995 RepID=UPI0023F07B9C|nr:NADH dehydrogenase subunit 6 [Neodiprion huizeensis]WDY84637.1 NADH dehydrogenase subunit 6 [Neodiprion huizeensis]